MGHEDSSEIHMDKYMVDKSDADQLIQHYFEVIHPVARCVHRPSFEADYVTYWFEVSQGLEPHGSVMALVFAAMFSAAVSLDEAACRNMKFSYKVRSKAELVQQLKLGTEAALTRANFLRTTRVATLQAFIMYMVRISLGRCFPWPYSIKYQPKSCCRYPSAEKKYLGPILSL